MGEDEERTPYYNPFGEVVNDWSEDSSSFYHDRDDNVEEKYDKDTGELVSQTYDGATYDPYGNLMSDDDDDDDSYDDDSDDSYDDGYDDGYDDSYDDGYDDDSYDDDDDYDY